MHEVETIIKKITSLKVLIPRYVKEEIKNEAKFIEELNRKQLKEGTKVDTTDMPEYVSNSKKSGKIDLFDTGEFHEGIDTLFDDEGFTLLGDDEKSSFLVKKYGKILGLTPENIAILVMRIIPRVRARLRKL